MTSTANNVTVAEMRKSLGKTLETSNEEEVVVMRHGKPIARLRGAAGEDLARIAEREAFWQMLADRAKGPSTPIDEVWDRMGVAKTAERRTRPRR